MLRSSLLASIAALVGMSVACDLANMLDVEVTTPQTDPAICLTQGADSWTFVMEVSEVVVPTFSAEDPWAGYSGSSGFAIYDNNCILKAQYDPHQDNNCGIPYVIRESFLTQVLTVTSVNYDVGDPYFSFTYGDGEYSVRNNQCVCNDTDDTTAGGLGVDIGCRCAFPIDGTF